MTSFYYPPIHYRIKTELSKVPSLFCIENGWSAVCCTEIYQFPYWEFGNGFKIDILDSPFQRLLILRLSFIESIVRFRTVNSLKFFI